MDPMGNYYIPRILAKKSSDRERRYGRMDISLKPLLVTPRTYDADRTRRLAICFAFPALVFWIRTVIGKLFYVCRRPCSHSRCLKMEERCSGLQHLYCYSRLVSETHVSIYVMFCAPKSLFTMSEVLLQNQHAMSFSACQDALLNPNWWTCWDLEHFWDPHGLRWFC